MLLTQIFDTNETRKFQIRAELNRSSTVRTVILRNLAHDRFFLLALNRPPFFHRSFGTQSTKVAGQFARAQDAVERGRSIAVRLSAPGFGRATADRKYRGGASDISEGTTRELWWPVWQTWQREVIEELRKEEQ